MAFLYVVTLVVAACSLAYELVLAQTLTALLGDTVLRYSITIGVYLGALGAGALWCGRRLEAPDTTPLERRLVRVELGLAALGGSAVPAFFSLDFVQRYIYFRPGVGEGSDWMPMTFLACTHLWIVAIGVLSGFEVPLLLRMGEARGEGTTPRLLGVDYLGSLVASVAFPLLLLPELGLLGTGFAVAGLNAVAALTMSVRWSRSVRPIHFVLGGALVAVCAGAMAQADRLEMAFLRTYYADTYDQGLRSALGAPVELDHHRSRHASIALLTEADPEQHYTDLLYPVREPKDLWLYIDGDFQFFSGIEATYHEWFVHVPVQQLGRPPRRALVLGGGDGMAVRELLAYDDLERVVHVEIDPVMLSLARTDPRLSRLNDPAFVDPRHEVVRADAFSWLRHDDARFDLVLIDMPVPRDHNLSAVYSREFYMEVRRHLRPGGVVALDAPDGSCRWEDGDWPIYSATLRAAGFEQVISYTSWVVAAPFVERIADAGEVELAIAGEEPLAGDEALGVWETLLDEAAATIPDNEFIFARVEPEPLVKGWVDMPSVEPRALLPGLMAVTFDQGCARHDDPDLVNSVFRPTLPEPQLLSVRRR